MKCKVCGFHVDDIAQKKCPRCNTIINLPHKCSECKGCSIFGGAGNSLKHCQPKKDNV